MATSSLNHSFVMSDPESIAKFGEAIEAYEHNHQSERKESAPEMFGLRTAEEIKAFLNGEDWMI